MQDVLTIQQMLSDAVLETTMAADALIDALVNSPRLPAFALVSRAFANIAMVCDELDESLLIVDGDDLVRYANPHAEASLGKLGLAAVGSHIDDILRRVRADDLYLPCGCCRLYRLET